MRANEKTIKDFIGGYDKVFLIPPFQRNYAWDKKNCKELWVDFETCAINDTSHYLGNIIYYPSENSGAAYTELILVDGQQRLTTILLLLVALRDKTKDEILRKDIDEKYLKNSTTDQRYRVKLKSITNDDDDFSKIVEEDTFNLPHSKIVANYKFFCKQIENTNIEHKKLFETIAKSEIVDINLQANNNLKLVQTVFEKINSTGKPLTSADLIRNLLLSSDSPSSQNKLYTNYWIKIEKTLEIDNVPDFVSDYLLIKTTQQSISNREVYDKFKIYRENSNQTNEQILADMLNYSEYYKFLITNSCPNVKIAKSIKEINILKASDLLPVLLLMLYKMFNEDQVELEKIFNLFADFILRYRLVGDYSGGGALQGNIRQIMNKLIDGTIGYKYNDVLNELSNSTTRDGEFPIDERFLKKLTTKKFSTDEAKILLSRIEYHNNKDVQIPFEKLTLEHIMPQSLSPKWKKYLGFDEEHLMKFHSEYLWNLGNLSLLSGSWNSSLSNKVFVDKKEHYKDNQFKITRNIIDNYLDWNKDSIERRAEMLAKIAIDATISPLPRTKPYHKDSGKAYASGQYFISDDIKTEGAKIRSLTYGNKLIECKHWYKLFSIVCEIMHKENPDKFKSVVENNLISKTTKNQDNIEIYGLDLDPMISIHKNLFNKAQKISDTNYYCESNLSSLAARNHSVKLIKEMGYDVTEFIIEII